EGFEPRLGEGGRDLAGELRVRMRRRELAREGCVVEGERDGFGCERGRTFVRSADQREVEACDPLTRPSGQLGRRVDDDAAEVVPRVVTLERVTDDVVDLAIDQRLRELAREPRDQVDVAAEDGRVERAIREASVDAAWRGPRSLEQPAGGREARLPGVSRAVGEHEGERPRELDPPVHAQLV